MNKYSKALLKWHLDAGVDIILEDQPVNHVANNIEQRQEGEYKQFQENRLQTQAQSSDWQRGQIHNQNLSYSSNTTPIKYNSMHENQHEFTASRPVLAGPKAAVVQARSLANDASNLQELEEAVRSFNGCSIKKTANKTVFCDGNPASRVMLIGEAPGANEDMQGIPFCGMSGKLMDEAFKWIGLTRKENMYISNTIFWRPPGNRKPTSEELEICRPFVEKHIALINPALLILVGGTAVESLLQTTGITKLRRKFFEYNNEYLDAAVKTTAIFHPSYLLRQPLQKRSTWQDLLFIKKFLEENASLS